MPALVMLIGYVGNGVQVLEACEWHSRDLVPVGGFQLISAVSTADEDTYR